MPGGECSGEAETLTRFSSPVNSIPLANSTLACPISWITAVDPLAAEYDDLLRRLDIDPPSRTNVRTCGRTFRHFHAFIIRSGSFRQCHRPLQRRAKSD